MDSIRRDLNHPSTKIQKQVFSLVIPLEVCTNKIFPLKVGTCQHRKQRKIRKRRGNDPSNVEVVEKHTY